MRKQIVILNGSGGVGKGELVKHLSTMARVKSISAVDKVKWIASFCGWNGEKDEVSRGFLSDLKNILIDFNDLPFKYISQEVLCFQNDLCGEYDILTIDIREPKEIARAVEAFGACAVLIKRECVAPITTNMADANVDNYTYDYTIYNNGTLAELGIMASGLLAFLENWNPS